MKFNTFQEAFIGINNEIIDNHEFEEDSRIGKCYERIGFRYEVTDLTSFKFEDEKVGRLDYGYMNTFYDWMIGGGTDIKSIAEAYPNVARFLEKPKSADLPANFNTFYGPRILSQLPFIKKELTANPNTRRAVISILDKDDLQLLDKDETLEFPCCDSATFLIRNNKLNIHLHMRSQNMGQVMKLDMFLWGKFACSLAKELGLEPGTYTSSVVSAHVFVRDVEYLKSLTLVENDKK